MLAACACLRSAVNCWVEVVPQAGDITTLKTPYFVPLSESASVNFKQEVQQHLSVPSFRDLPPPPPALSAVGHSSVAWSSSLVCRALSLWRGLSWEVWPVIGICTLELVTESMTMNPLIGLLGWDLWALCAVDRQVM